MKEIAVIIAPRARAHDPRIAKPPMLESILFVWGESREDFWEMVGVAVGLVG